MPSPTPSSTTGPTPYQPEYEQVAQISKTKGLDGQLIAHELGGLSVLRPGLEVWIVPPTLRGIRHTQVASIQRDQHKQGVVLYLEGIDDRTQASELLDRYLLAKVPEGSRRPSWSLSTDSERTLDHDEGNNTLQDAHGEVGEYSSQATGSDEPWTREDTLTPAKDLSFSDVTHGELGILTQVKQGPAYDIWVIEGPYGVLEVPAVEAYLVEEDEEKLVLDLPKGFIEMTSVPVAKKTQAAEGSSGGGYPEEAGFEGEHLKGAQSNSARLEKA